MKAGPMPSRPTLSLTAQSVRAAPHVKMVLIELGSAMTGVPASHVADHWNVSIPPIPVVTLAERFARMWWRGSAA